MTVCQWVRIPTFRSNVIQSSSRTKIPRRNIEIRLFIGAGSRRRGTESWAVPLRVSQKLSWQNNCYELRDFVLFSSMFHMFLPSVPWSWLWKCCLKYRNTVRLFWSPLQGNKASRTKIVEERGKKLFFNTKLDWKGILRCEYCSFLKASFVRDCVPPWSWCSFVRYKNVSNTACRTVYRQIYFPVWFW